MRELMTTPFEIVKDDEMTVATGQIGEIVMIGGIPHDVVNERKVIVTADTPATVFRRRGVKGVGGTNPQAIEWAVVELADGTRIYYDGSTVMVTKKDIRP